MTKVGVVALIAFSICLAGCRNAVTKKSNFSKVLSQTIIDEDALSDDKQKTLDSLKSLWYNDKAFECLRASTIAPNCGDPDAGGISVTFVVAIDDSGKVVHSEITNEALCAATPDIREEVKNCLLKNINVLTFPESLRNLKVRYTVRHYVKS